MTSWKFNPPPGWPQQPEGWVPPPGWTPDPQWPPAPAGWEFWVPAGAPSPSADPTAAGTAGPPATHTGTANPAGAAAANPAGAAAATEAGAGAAGEAAAAPPPQGGFSVHDAPTSLAVTGHAGAPTSPAADRPAGQHSGPPAGPGQPASTPPAAYPPGPYPPRMLPAASGSVPVSHRWSAFVVLAVLVLLIGCIGGGTMAMLVTASGEATPPAPLPTPSETPGGGGTQASGGLQPGQQRTGQGPSIVPLSLPGSSFHMITLTYDGDDFFIIRLVDGQGGLINSLASGRGPITGVYPVELGSFEVPAAVDLADGEGRWTVALSDIAEAPMWPAQSQGRGDMVLRIDPQVAAGQPELIGGHDGASNFIVWAYGATGFDNELMFNEIGEHHGSSGERRLPAGALVLVIRADGEWQIDRV